MQMSTSTFHVWACVPVRPPCLQPSCCVPACVSLYPAASFHFGPPFASGPPSWAAPLRCGWARSAIGLFPAPTNCRLCSMTMSFGRLSYGAFNDVFALGAKARAGFQRCLCSVFSSNSYCYYRKSTRCRAIFAQSPPTWQCNIIFQ